MSNFSGDTPPLTEALLWKPREAAKALAISERTLWGLTNRNQIPHVRIGRAVRYAPADLLAWIEAQKHRSVVNGDDHSRNELGNHA